MVCMLGFSRVGKAMFFMFLYGRSLGVIAEGKNSSYIQIVPGKVLEPWQLSGL